MAAEPVHVTQYTDPSCPWAYSAEPFLRALEWRYGDGLVWRTVVIGLSEDTVARERAGVTPASRVAGWKGYETRFGMPVSSVPRTRLISSGRACRAVKAAEHVAAGTGARLMRALRMAWFTSTLLLDTDAGIAAAAGATGLDGGTITAAIADPAVEDAYQRDRAEARGAAQTGQAAVAQDRAAVSADGARFTAPSLVFTRGSDRLVAGGWQPFDAYDLCIANLAPELPRRPAPEPQQLLARYPGGLVTVEVAEVCRDRNDDRDPAATAAALAELEQAGAVWRSPIGDDASLWSPVA
ncbi:MAG TPA: DsbA family protein [Gaiellales bacterium]